MYWTDLFNQFAILGILAMSLNLLLGCAGQVSVAHAAFAAIGGYATAYLCIEHGWAVLPTVAVGALVAMAVGLLVGVPALLLSDDYFILLSLAVQMMIIIVISSVGSFGGLYGLTGLPSPAPLGDPLLLPNDWFLPLLVTLVAVFVLLAWIGESPFGAVLRGIREDHLVTLSLGKDVFVRKLLVFGMTSAIAATGGALLGLYNGIVSPPMFGFSTSILLVAMVVLGGSGNILGALLGTGIVVGAQPLFERVFLLAPDQAALVRLIGFGILLTLIMTVRPQGLLPEGATPWEIAARRRRAVHSAGDNLTSEAPAAELASLAGTHRVRDSHPVVTVEEIQKSFGGIKAVDGLSFDLLEGRVTGLIGPNGAGKTTVFNLLTGTLPPDQGKVTAFGQDITGWPIDRVARLGVMRSFQDVRVFGRLSVYDNVRLAVPNQRGETLRDLFLRPRQVIRDRVRVRGEVLRALDFLGLRERHGARVSTLPFGEQKLVALARIFAADARVLLLDEPAAGLDHEWVERMADIIARLSDHGLTICLVEHNLEFVERVADRIFFMEAGRITASGALQDLVADERLREAYFGRR